jgi:hypothetical protein
VALSGSPAHSILMTISGPRAGRPAGLAIWLNDEAAATQAMLADARRLQGPLAALLARGLGLRLSMLMSAGPMGEAEILPPLLLSLRGG